MLKIALTSLMLVPGLVIAPAPLIQPSVASSGQQLLEVVAQPDTLLLAQQSSRISRPAQRRVQVFFPRYPGAANDFTQVGSVWRSTSSTSVARFALEQLFAGPTSAERQQGLAPAIRFRGRSNCNSDFSISISGGVANLQLCRQVISNGVGDDARAKSAIEATLRQFSSIDRVVILNFDGSCFGDQSGNNLCLASR